MDKMKKLLAKAGSKTAAGRLSEAVEIYRKIVAQAPRHLDAQYLLGSLLAEMGQLDEAEKHLAIASTLNPGSPYIWNNLGNISFLRGDEAGALSAWERALSLNADLPEAWSNMGLIHHRNGRSEQAESCMRKATALKNIPYAWSVLATLAEKKGQTDEAAAICRMLLQAMPEHAESAFMLARLEGRPMPQAPREMIRSMFDAYASRFDQHLLGGLSYSTPGLIRQAIEQHVGGRHFRRVADLGCGTGLMGLEMQGLAGHLTGVDLSPRMLKEAASRNGIYDRLVEADIVEFLCQEQEPFDLILATDVLVYFGDLGAWFDAARDRSTSPGWLVFSTENAECGEWVLRSSGRYAHAREYVRSAGEAAGWRMIDCETVTVRMESGQPLSGNIYVFQR